MPAASPKPPPQRRLHRENEQALRPGQAIEDTCRTILHFVQNDTSWAFDVHGLKSREALALLTA